MRRITDFFPTANGNPLQTQPDDDPPLDYVMDHIKFKETGDNFEAKFSEKGWEAITVGNLEIETSRQGHWISYINVETRYHRRGIATTLVEKALEKYGRLLASNMPPDAGDAGDTRYLSDDGAALVNALRAKGYNIEYADPNAD